MQALTVKRLCLSLLLLALPQLVRAGGDWNDKGIAWQTYEAGLKQAEKEKKPVCLIFYTEWCPHCTNYSKLFHQQPVIDKAKNLVMIRLDNDKSPDQVARFAPDGKYIPRTFFLSPKGELLDQITAGRPQYKYFYSESDASSLLASMDQALATVKP